MDFDNSQLPRKLHGCVLATYFLSFKYMQMAEQLLISGCIDEAQLQNMDMVRARTDIGITLLSYSGIAS